MTGNLTFEMLATYLEGMKNTSTPETPEYEYARELDQELLAAYERYGDLCGV